MEWPEDFKFSVKKTSKKGRRANEKITSEVEEKSDSMDNTDLSNQSSVCPPKGKRIAVWSESGGKSGKYERSRSGGKNLIEFERFNQTSVTSDYPSEDDIPIIPDLDELQEELFMNEVVEPPVLAVNRVSTLKELNSELLKQSVFSTLDDIDLSVLTQRFQYCSMVDEEDDLWEWGRIFTEITMDIISDKTVPNSVNTQHKDGGRVLTSIS